jgi:glyoxylase-like metal-dependent hydrolase (beta-lactamase superfamily II)/rhodanese-related sulfurtransferase
MALTYKQLNPHSCKTYLIGMEGRKEVILIDPVIEHVNDYGEMIKDGGFKLEAVIDTHTHADHISGGASLKDMFECEYWMHENAPAQCATMKLAEGSELKLFAQVPARVLYSPGHTRDSISLIFPDRVFTGDALFLDDGGAGRDDLPGGDPGAHWETLRRLWDLPEDLIVYPAHDYRGREPSALGLQKKTNAHFSKCRESRESFIQYLEDLKLGPADWMKDVLKANYACARDPRAAWIPVDAPTCEVKGTMDVGANEVQVRPISPAALKEKLGSDPAPVLLDVREEKELKGPLGHLPGIIHIPIASLSHRLSELDRHKKREIVAVCRSGSRASSAAQILTVAGFKNVTVLEGGMKAWNASPDLKGLVVR